MSDGTAVSVGRQFVIDDADRSIFKVNRSTMTRADIFEEEQTKIFDRCWVYLGHESEVPNANDFKTRTVGGRSLLFTRDSAGVLHAYLNTCPHRGATVCREEEGSAKRFTCFYHGWTFGNDGSLLCQMRNPTDLLSTSHASTCRTFHVLKATVASCLSRSIAISPIYPRTSVTLRSIST